MSATTATIVAIVSACVALASFLVNGRATWRKDDREQKARDDAEADRLISLKDQRIEALSSKVDQLEGDLNALAKKVHELEQMLDQYGCWNGPKCKNRKPLGGPKPEAVTI